MNPCTARHRLVRHPRPTGGSAAEPRPGHTARGRARRRVLRRGLAAHYLHATAQIKMCRTSIGVQGGTFRWTSPPPLQSSFVVSFVKSVTFDCRDAIVVASFWAAALGSNVDEDSTPDKAWVEPPGWGGPTLWFGRVPESKTAKNRQHFDLRAVGNLRSEVERLEGLGATVVRDGEDLVVMADPEGNEFCIEP